MLIADMALMTAKVPLRVKTMPNLIVGALPVQRSHTAVAVVEPRTRPQVKRHGVVIYGN